MKTSIAIAALEQWYSSQCNGDWEHQFGLKIETLDNPGWSVTIDLVETELEDKPFPELRDNYEDEDDWMRCRRTATAFEGVSGPHRLADILQVFFEWAGISIGGEA